MAKYEVVSLVWIGKYLRMLNKYTKSVLDNPSEENVRAFAIYLYEYMVIRNGFHKVFGDSDEEYEGIELNLSHIKGLIPNTNEHRHALIMLKYYADTFRHLPIITSGDEYFRTILESHDLYKEIFSILLPKGSNVYKFLMSRSALTRVYSRSSRKVNLRACKLYASKCLRFDNNLGRSNCTVGETVTLLKRKFGCSMNDALRVVYSIIKGGWWM